MVGQIIALSPSLERPKLWLVQRLSCGTDSDDPSAECFRLMMSIFFDTRIFLDFKKKKRFLVCTAPPKKVVDRVRSCGEVEMDFGTKKFVHRFRGNVSILKSLDLLRKHIPETLDIGDCKIRA
jgi:hypothetical protein